MDEKIEQQRTPLTLEAHAQIGRDLLHMREQLSALMLTSCHAYGPAHRTVQRLARTLGQIDKLRAAMDNQMFIDCPKHATSSMYYAIDTTLMDEQP